MADLDFPTIGGLYYGIDPSNVLATFYKGFVVDATPSPSTATPYKIVADLTE